MGEFVFLKILTSLALPPASMVVGLIAASAFTLLGFHKLGRAVGILAVAELAILSVPPVADALVSILEDQAQEAAVHTPACCYAAIAVLGGGIQPAIPPTRPEPHLVEGADRIWFAARLFHRGVAPLIIVSGRGYGGPASTEAGAMRLLLLDFGVPSDAIILDGEARNTFENIKNVHALVKDGRVALVTSAFHMPRALRFAQLAHMSVGAFPTDFRSVPATHSPWESLGIPSLQGLSTSTVALREILALVFDRRGAEAAE